MNTLEASEPLNELLRRSTHRSAPIKLPPDAGQAAAYVLSFVQSADMAFDRSAAIEAMNDRIKQLQGSDGDTVEKELLAHSQVLQALFMRLSVQAVETPKVDHKAVFLKLALSCQAAYTKTVVCAEGLRLQRQGQGLIQVS